MHDECALVLHTTHWVKTAVFSQVILTDHLPQLQQLFKNAELSLLSQLIILSFISFKSLLLYYFFYILTAVSSPPSSSAHLCFSLPTSPLFLFRKCQDPSWISTKQDTSRCSKMSYLPSWNLCLELFSWVLYLYHFHPLFSTSTPLLPFLRLYFSYNYVHFAHSIMIYCVCVCLCILPTELLNLYNVGHTHMCLRLTSWDQISHCRIHQWRRLILLSVVNTFSLLREY